MEDRLEENRSQRSFGDSNILPSFDYAFPGGDISQPTRKFTSKLQKPGNARLMREAIVSQMKTTNPTRSTPIPAPTDYEKFVLENSNTFERDKDRDLLLFARDDFSAVETKRPQKAGMPKERQNSQDQAKVLNPSCAGGFLLTHDALQQYSRPVTVLNFNYANYAGDYRKSNIPSQNLSPLKFESDIMEAENERFLQTQSKNQRNDILRQGFLTILPNDASFVDNFRSEKKRYCIVRKNENGQLLFEVYKHSTSSNTATTSTANVPQKQIEIEVKIALLKTTKKGRAILQLSNELEKNISLSAETDSELVLWLIEIDRALVSNTEKDTLSLNSSNCEHPNTVDSQSMQSEDSMCVSTTSSYSGSQTTWRGSKLAAKWLKPPIIQRRNPFVLYANLKPLSKLPIEPSCFVTGLSKNDGADSNLSPLEIGIQLYDLNIKLSLASAPPKQVEPFFLRIFIYDMASGFRVTEEWRHIALAPNISEDGFNEVLDDVLGGGEIMPRKNSSSRSTAISPAIEGILRKSRKSSHNSNKMSCLIEKPTSTMYAILLIERLLIEPQFSDIYSKANSSIDTKTSAKLVRSIEISTNRLGFTFRSLLGWSAWQLIPDANNALPCATYKANPTIYKSGRLNELDLQRILSSDLSKLERTGKLFALPNSTISFDVNVKMTEQSRKQSSSSSAKSESSSHHIRSFQVARIVPHTNYTNLLYVYPLALNFSSQKAFSKARNIGVSIHFVHLKRLTNLQPSTSDAASHQCAVYYHEQNPQFNEEVRIDLPCGASLDENCYLLFQFRHISLSSVFSTNFNKRPNNPSISGTGNGLSSFETSVGFSWLQLVTHRAGSSISKFALSEDVQEFELPVALSPSLQELVHNGDLHTLNNIKFIDNGKPLFRFRARLVSTVLTSSSKIQSFFEYCRQANAIATENAELNNRPQSALISSTTSHAVNRAFHKTNTSTSGSI